MTEWKRTPWYLRVIGYPPQRRLMPNPLGTAWGWDYAMIWQYQ